MKAIFCRLLVLSVFSLMILPIFGQNTGTMSVQVRETQMRQRNSFLAPVVIDLAYGDKVSVLQEAGSWVQVRFGSSEGWVSTSALTTQEIVLQAGAADVDRAATSNEVALAGRGFNSEVEAEYRSANDMDYTSVDKMETFLVDYRTINDFLGDLGSPLAEGGAQ